jgi:hypothetical protein
MTLSQQKKAGRSGMHLSSQQWQGILKKDCGPCWPGQKQDPFSKVTRAKRAGHVTQVIELLPSKHEALSSNSSNSKKKKEMTKPPKI